jgi:uncharacterized protein
MKHMKKRTLLILLSLLLITFAVPLKAAESPIPIPSPNSSFYVLDQSNVLDSDTEQAILQTSVALQQQTKAQIVVVTVKSLGDYVLEDYSLAILRRWGIGDKKLNNGVLILVSPEEHVARIEVGYGLEGALPDSKTGRIQDEYMIPYFKQNDYNQGILNGYRAVAQEVAKEYKVSLDVKNPQKMPASTPASEPLPKWVSIAAVILVIVLIYLDQRYLDGFILGFILGMLFRGGRGGPGGGGFGGGGGGGFSGGGGSGGGGGSSRRW